MKTLLILALLGSAAIAQAAADTQGNASVDTQVVSGARYKVSDWEFAVYKGRYQTEDGGTVKVSQQDNKFYTQINGQAPIEILAAGPDSFISRDGRTKVDFRQNANGDLMEVAVSAVTSSVAAVSAR
jgi:hypothetical protein